MNATARLYLAKEALSRFDAAVSISGSRDLGLAKRVVLIPNPIDPIYYSPLSDHPRNGLAVVASIKRIKQIHHVFVAAESLGVSPSIEITVAGATENAAYLKELKALAESCTHIRVSWSGRLDALGLKSLYDRSKALVLASQWEISPLCVAEAMVRRCPVIVPDHPGTCELVGGGERGSMYAAGSVDQLSRAIRTALLSPDSVIEMTRAAQEWAVPRFDVSAVAQDTAALYRSLTS
jgi:glycosyltransferase involved in cell wall biosynthesis